MIQTWNEEKLTLRGQCVCNPTFDDLAKAETLYPHGKHLFLAYQKAGFITSQYIWFFELRLITNTHS